MSSSTKKDRFDEHDDKNRISDHTVHNQNSDEAADEYSTDFSSQAIHQTATDDIDLDTIQNSGQGIDQDVDQQSQKNSSEGLQSIADSRVAIAELEASVHAKEKELEDWKNKAYRFSADLQNLSKQNQLDLQQARKKGKQTVIELLLPFVNTMNLSFAFIPESDDESLKTFVATLKGSFEKLIADFGAAGIEFLVPDIGEEVDTEYMSVLNATGEEDDTIKVARVVGVGVRIDGQLVQEATVMV